MPNKSQLVHRAFVILDSFAKLLEENYFPIRFGGVLQVLNQKMPKQQKFSFFRTVGLWPSRVQTVPGILHPDGSLSAIVFRRLQDLSAMKFLSWLKATRNMQNGLVCFMFIESLI